MNVRARLHSCTISNNKKQAENPLNYGTELRALTIPCILFKLPYGVFQENNWKEQG